MASESNMWDLYQRRINRAGPSKRDAALKREAMTLRRRIYDSLSCQTVKIDGEMQDVAIINSDNYNEKRMISLPGEDIKLGAEVEWMDNHWLVTERDANTTIYTRVKLLQCNYFLKWVSYDKRVWGQWCVVEDGTKLRNSFRVVKAA